MLNNFLDSLVKEKKLWAFSVGRIFWCSWNTYKHIQLLMLSVLSQLQKQNKWTRYKYMHKINTGQTDYICFVIDDGHLLKKKHECGTKLWCSLILSQGLATAPQCYCGTWISHRISLCELVYGENFLCSLGPNASFTCHPAPCLLSSLAPDSLVWPSCKMIHTHTHTHTHGHHSPVAGPSYNVVIQIIWNVFSSHFKDTVI